MRRIAPPTGRSCALSLRSKETDMVRGMVLDFGRLVGKAFVLAVAIGLLLTLAAAALPAQEKETGTPPGEATSGRLLVRRANGEPWATAPTLATEVCFR